MDRVTQNDVRVQFERLCKLYGKRIATSYKDVGAWSLDHNGVYGGYTVIEYVPSGGETHPFGGWGKRRNARDFVQWVFDTYEAIALYVGGWDKLDLKRGVPSREE